MTVSVPATPEVVGEGRPDTTSVGAAGFTTMSLSEPAIEELAVSVALTDWLPAVTRTSPVNLWTPASAAVKV